MMPNEEKPDDARHPLQGVSTRVAIPQLVARVYEDAPAEERIRLVEYLVRPLGLFALLAVANGVFARIWFRNPGQELRMSIEDALNVRPDDVMALADFVQQASHETVNGLLQVLASPALAGSVAVSVLVAELLRRRQARQGRVGG